MADRVLLFGGTFDPVHLGHLVTARAVAEAHGFERVELVPAASPPHKAAARAAGEQRLEMLRRAVEGDDLFDLCTLELFRQGPSYTYDTLVDLRNQYGPAAELHWVIGADMLASLDTWHRATKVLDLARIVVAARPPWDQRMDAVYARLADRLDPRHVECIRRLAVSTPLLDISSTDIRARVAAGRSIRYLVPEPVRDYIEQGGLYR